MYLLSRASVCSAFSPPATHFSTEPRVARPIAPWQFQPRAGPTPCVFSFGHFFYQMRLTGDHHFYVADHSPGARVRVELDRIADDVEVRALNRGPFLRA